MTIRLASDTSDPADPFEHRTAIAGRVTRNAEWPAQFSSVAALLERSRASKLGRHAVGARPFGSGPASLIRARPFLLIRRQGRQPGPEPKRPQWEYREIHLSALPRKTNVLNDTSANGWEQVVITVNNIAYLKRRVAGPTAPSPSSPSRKSDAG